MNLLVLNGHGLGNPCTERELGEIIWAKDPSVMFIAKTWADEARLDRTLSIMKSLNNTNSLFFKSLKQVFFLIVLFWKQKIQFQVYMHGRLY